MITEIAADIVAKLDAIPALTGKVGLATGGRSADPTLSKAPLPLAWAVFQSMKPLDPPANQQAKAQSMQLAFHVCLVVPYISQEDLETVQYPLIEACLVAIRGTQSPSKTNWRFEGITQQHMNVDRLYYDLRFTLNSHL